MKTKTKAQQLKSDVVLHIRIDKQMWEILTRLAIENDRTLMGQVRACLRHDLGLGYQDAAQHRVQPTGASGATDNQSGDNRASG